jgi:tetratricopeptide (TPR) repeat protein
MKNLKILAGCLSILSWLLLAGCDTSEKIPSAIGFYYNLDSAKSAANEKNRPLIIEFYKQGCPWSKMLDDSTFAHKIVQAMAEKMIFAKIDADQDTSITQKYNISFFPTIIVAGSDGVEIDRLVGYYPPSDFYNEVQLYLQGNETLDDYLTRLADEPDNAEYHLIIAEKYKHRSDWDKALEYYNNVLNFAGDDNGHEKELAVFGIADVQCEKGRYQEAIASFKDFIERYPESEKAENAVRKIPYCLVKLGEYKLAGELYQKYLEDYPDGEFTAWVNENLRNLDSVLQKGR